MLAGIIPATIWKNASDSRTVLLFSMFPNAEASF